MEETMEEPILKLTMDELIYEINDIKGMKYCNSTKQSKNNMSNDSPTYVILDCILMGISFPSLVYFVKREYPKCGVLVEPMSRMAKDGLTNHMRVYVKV